MALSFRQRKRLPKPKDIVLIQKALSIFPVEEPRHGWRESLKGVINYRIQAITNGKPWSVDTYAGGFYVVTIGEQVKPCKTVLSLILFMCQILGGLP